MRRLAIAVLFIAAAAVAEMPKSVEMKWAVKIPLRVVQTIS